MSQPLKLLSMCFLLLALVAARAHGQESTDNIFQSRNYLEHRSHALKKYLQRSERIRQRLLRKLHRKEDKMLRALAAKDSSLYNQYIQNPVPSYDSIAALSADSGFLHRQSLARNAVTDSLKGIQQFLQQQSAKANSVADLAGKAGVDLPYVKEISNLQQQFNAQSALDGLMQQRSKVLEGMASQAGLSGFAGIEKDLHYAREKIKAWKALADDPDAAEEAALEYLQGTEGFAESLKGSSANTAFGGLGNNATAEQLQAMGYQTKSQVNSLLQQKLGSSMNSVQQQMAGQVKDYTDKLGDITAKVKDAREGLDDAKRTLSEVRQAKDQLRHLEKPRFRNPERGKPFWLRLERQFTFQTTRATPDGLRPAMLEAGAGVAYKQTPKLSYGIGISGSLGLGQNWQNIRFSWEGVSLRVYADWKLLYGFSAQAGYERAFRPTNRKYLPDAKDTTIISNAAGADNIFKEAFGGQQQAAYIGLMKRYKINSKWNGTLLIGYNFLWQQEGLRNPWILRLGWAEK